jgi:hypothetical protein
MIRKRPKPGRDCLKVVVVFDLDGTLTVRDTSLPFVAHAVGARRLAGIVAARCPLFLADLLGATHRELNGPARLGCVCGCTSYARTVALAVAAVRLATAGLLGRPSLPVAGDSDDQYAHGHEWPPAQWHRGSARREGIGILLFSWHLFDVAGAMVLPRALSAWRTATSPHA